MEDFSLQEVATHWIAVAILVILLILWIAGGWLWNNKYRPMRLKKGNPTPTFNNALKRIFKFVLKEDVQPSGKIKSPGLKKILIWRNLYFALILVSIVLPIIGISPLIPIALLFLISFVRVKRVFRDRNAILERMFEVANSEFRYKKDASLNPWMYVNIQEWENLVTPGKTVVMFPPAFRVDNPMKRTEFEQHFDGTVAEENVWSYEWNGAKGVVECAPVSHLPTMAEYPGSEDRPWDEIPLGIGINGEIVWKLSDVPHMLICGSTGGGKSVLQRNIIFHVIQHSDKIKFLGVDLKRVELDQFAKYEDTVLGIAKDLEDGVEVMRYARDAMMERYGAMEQMGVNHFQNMPSPPPALMVMVDEAYMFMAPSGGKTDEQKERDQLNGEATVIIGEIARLGRAAGVHLVLATQRPDAKVIYGEIKANLGARYMAGRSQSIPSLMVLDSDTGTRIPSIKGRGVVSFDGEEEFIHGYFSPSGWIDEWLARNQAGTDSSLEETEEAEEEEAEEGTFPKKKREKGSFRKRFKGLKPVPDFDNGELIYGEPSEVPEGIFDHYYDENGEDKKADTENLEEADEQVTSAPVNALLDDLDEENGEAEEDELSEPAFMAPDPTPQLSLEDEEEEAEEEQEIYNAFANRPNLRGGSIKEEAAEMEWDDDLNDLTLDTQHNAPQEEEDAKKIPLPPRPPLAKDKAFSPTANTEDTGAKEQEDKSESLSSKSKPKIPPVPKMPPTPKTPSSQSKEKVSTLPSLPSLPPRP